MNIFVAFFLLLLLLEDTTPSASSSFPLLGTYYCLNMGIITLSTFLSCIIVNFHFRGDSRREVPFWLKKFVIRYASKIFLVDLGPKYVNAFKEQEAAKKQYKASEEPFVLEHHVMSQSEALSSDTITNPNYKTPHRFLYKGVRKQTRFENTTNKNDLNSSVRSQEFAFSSPPTATSMLDNEMQSLNASNNSCRSPLFVSGSEYSGYHPEKLDACADEMRFPMYKFDTNNPMSQYWKTRSISFSQYSSLKSSFKGQKNQFNRLNKDVSEILKSVHYLQETHDKKEILNRIFSDWRAVGIVLDRIFFIIYMVSIILSITFSFPQSGDDVEVGNIDHLVH